MKMNWKEVSYRFLTIVLLVFIGGCTAEHLGDQAQVSAVSAKRSLPKTYMPGEPVKVILDLDVLPCLLVAVFSPALLSSAFAEGWESQWPMYGHDWAHNGRSSAKEPTTPHLLWSYDSCEHIGSLGSPVVGPDGTVYISTRGDFVAINPDGMLKWRRGWNSLGAPAVGDDGTVYIANNVWGGLHAFEPTHGDLLWSYPTDASIYGSPTIVPDGTLYVMGRKSGQDSTDNEVLYAFGDAFTADVTRIEISGPNEVDENRLNNGIWGDGGIKTEGRGQKI